MNVTLILYELHLLIMLLAWRMAVYDELPPYVAVRDSILIQLRIAKNDKKLTYKDIARLSDGLMSERTVERLFNGESNISPERYEFLERILGINRMFGELLQGPSDISHIVIHEIMSLNRKQQMLILELCRELNKKE